MRLHELAVACYAYDALTPFNEAFKDFRDATNPAPDLRRREHRTELLRFLNRWGCRLPREHKQSQSEALLAWNAEWDSELPSPDTRAWDLTDTDLDRAAHAFDALKETPAYYSESRRGGQTVRIGPTAAGKVLFVLRPHAFPPPDEASRTNMKREGLAASYRDIIGWVREECHDLAEQCEQHGLALDDLPGAVGRPQDTVVHLVQEYMWVKFTREVALPEPSTLRLWTTWTGTSAYEQMDDAELAVAETQIARHLAAVTTVRERRRLPLKRGREFDAQIDKVKGQADRRELRRWRGRSPS